MRRKTKYIQGYGYVTDLGKEVALAAGKQVAAAVGDRIGTAIASKIIKKPKPLPDKVRRAIYESL